MSNDIKLKLTPEQLDIAEAAGGEANLMIKAFAGTGKTSTLEHCVAPNITGNALALAFNVKNKQDLERRFPQHFTVLSLNGLGHRAWGAAIGKRLRVEDRKLSTLLTAESKRLNMNLTSDDWASCRRLINQAMNSGLVPSSFPHKPLLTDTAQNWTQLAIDIDMKPEERLLEFSRGVLIASIKQSFDGLISYDDQIYMSAMFGGQFPRYPNVLVDEAQDLSPLNHIQVQRCAANRLIVVGDPLQAIYAFRGADHESMDRLRALRKDWTDLTLSVTFRCPRKVVARQQEHAPGYTAHVANGDGTVLQFPPYRPGAEPDAEAEDLPVWRWTDIPQHLGQVAVLCRNNAPLLKLAFKLIRRQIPPMMLGRDIGKSLIALSKNIEGDDDARMVDFIPKLEDWKETQTQLAIANEREDKIANIEDRYESLLAVAETAPGVKTAGDLRSALSHLFDREEGRVTLSSIHRAKGAEWPVVVHLDPWRIPSKYARKAASKGDMRQMRQELNLRYVCETRTQSTLILASLSDFD